MNIKNLDFLKDQLKYIGFGEKLNADLEKQIEQQPDTFQIKAVAEYGKDKYKQAVEYALDFRKSDQTDMYFFNKYRATLKHDDPTQEKSQTFYINKNTGITTKEAFNLLSGRAVHKELANAEGKPYNAWLQLDFNEKDKHDNFKVKQFHSGYGYDLGEVISRYPIKELSTPDEAAKLLKSLDKGNVQQVTFIREGREEKMFIAANPQYKNLDLYNVKMEKQYQSNEKKQKTEQDKVTEKKETANQEVEEEGETKRQKKSAKRKGVGV